MCFRKNASSPPPPLQVYKSETSVLDTWLLCPHTTTVLNDLFFDSPKVRPPVRLFNVKNHVIEALKATDEWCKVLNV